MSKAGYLDGLSDMPLGSAGGVRSSRTSALVAGLHRFSTRRMHATL
jgi:hypothetical protein